MKEHKSHPLVQSCNPKTCISGIMMRSNRIIANIFRKYLKQFDLTDSQLSILFVISKISKINQKIISEFLYMEKSTVHRNLNRLIKKEYITSDSQKYLHMTDNGLDFLESVIPHWNEAMEESKKILGKEGEAALSVLLSKLEG